MKKKTKKALISSAAGVAVGLVNGTLGAGGGMLAVPVLRKLGLDQKASHANAVAVILPIAAVSALLYIFKGYVQLSDGLTYIPTGLVGSYLGTLAIKKISPIWLTRIFGIVMIYAGVRLLLR